MAEEPSEMGRYVHRQSRFGLDELIKTPPSQFEVATQMALHLYDNSKADEFALDLIKEWCGRNHGGLIVIDGLNPPSPIHEWWLNQVGFLEYKSFGVVNS